VTGSSVLGKKQARDHSWLGEKSVREGGGGHLRSGKKLVSESLGSMERRKGGEGHQAGRGSYHRRARVDS
jgi:hypothetical protein